VLCLLPPVSSCLHHTYNQKEEKKGRKMKGMDKQLRGRSSPTEYWARVMSLPAAMAPVQPDPAELWFLIMKLVKSLPSHPLSVSLVSLSLFLAMGTKNRKKERERKKRGKNKGRNGEKEEETHS
jgi:hypothetical protein